MIIGNGLIWKALKKIDSDQYIFFASGVSDSKITDKKEFEREERLLHQHLDNTNKPFIYFSSCSIYDKSLGNSPYIKHKKNIENIIESSWKKYLIVRIWNIVWNQWNTKNIMNYLHDCIVSGKSFEIWSKSERFMLDVDDLVNMLGIYLQEITNWLNQIINISNPYPVKIIDIVKLFEKLLTKEAIYNCVDKWINIVFDTKISKRLFTESDQNKYISKIINKYYLWVK